jgi:myo-inositol-1(or 4)-monophosphatase
MVTKTTMWEKELEVAGMAARAGGKILQGMFGRTNRIVKKGEIDLVTEADFEAEKGILEVIRRNFPNDKVLSEETGVHGESSDRTWLVDPLDGTTNFAHRFPFFAVSIALEFKKEIVLGIVYNPYMDEYFEAAQKMGAFLNRKSLRVSEVQTLEESLLGTGFPYDVHERPEKVMRLFKEMVIKAQGIRRPGSAALDLCYVAAGRFDGFWESDLKPWDTAAGTIIVQEAGGKLSTFEGTSYNPYQNSIVASNTHIHDAMLKVLRA